MEQFQGGGVMKRIFVISSIVITLMLVYLVLYFKDMQMNSCLEFGVPKLTKREKIELQSKDLRNDEKLIKIYFSKNQMKMLLKEIKKNNNWKNTQLDERLNKKINFYTREEIYNKIPNIEDACWIFTNRSNRVEDTHSIEQLLDDMYYTVSLGILDLDNNILYYYEYDR